MEVNDSQDKMPTSKVARATRFIGAGAKVGSNYIRHYVKKAFDPTTEKSELDKANAEDIYKVLSELKGSALKMAQMLAMDRSLLPTEYIQEFQKAQYKAPPLSGPLIVQTFQRTLGKSPYELFDTFEEKAVNAARKKRIEKKRFITEAYKRLYCASILQRFTKVGFVQYAKEFEDIEKIPNSTFGIIWNPIPSMQIRAISFPMLKKESFKNCRRAFDCFVSALKAKSFHDTNMPISLL